ncbi:hypothetical protein GKE82_22295 [Conexibacter sp. W3-3-2]|uniref:DUF1440 domain-containing protein n=1 Tax=Paraconexibacter algicola TaxID=2133960 RepID=A0A2T4UFC3_9ACTN|nr:MULTISPECIES: hypothetical protein [Solirubrobacterales]MTD46943.1 hypothetical protein [Conexibacter sp. W3-3-2]PTL56489.1 hypothetical protein C7Y72_16140 [Paraconexibacter algicola]
MPTDPARIARGAAAGAVAATVWALQQPADQRVFGVAYDDTELLGKLVTRGPAWRPVGFAMHVANGAAFGAGYAAVRDRLPLPAAARGPFVAMVENVASWPGVAAADRLHPARDELPKLWRTPGAFPQATWRHLLFGVVLGEVERRLNR